MPSDCPAPFSSSDPSFDSSDMRVLILTPEETHDNTTLLRSLTDAGFHTCVCPSVDALRSALRDGAGVVVVMGEAVTEDAVRFLMRALDPRPPWSNLPLIVLTGGSPSTRVDHRTLDLFTSDAGANVTLLERPVDSLTLTTVVRSALRARQRQYQVRDLLRGLQAENAELRASREALETANASLEDRLTERMQQVRDLALAITTAEQRERTRISHILHDHLQQILHSAKMWAELAIDEPSTRKEGLPRLVNLLDEGLDTTRSLTAELNPPVLREQGLSAALDWLADHVAERHGLDVTLDIPSPFDVPNGKLRTLLFQLTRELLFNVVKHAEVNTATVRARIRPALETPPHSVPVDAPIFDEPPVRTDQVEISVEDTGTGFDPSAEPGHGLSSVRERLTLVGGTCDIDSAPGAGTRVTITAPLSIPSNTKAHSESRAPSDEYSPSEFTPDV